jgi:tetratricopeptide (TPR) repeat protein
LDVPTVEASSIFVLFASKAALASLWVDFETGEARRALILRNLARTVVFIIDPSLKRDALPQWLLRSRVVHDNAPAPVAREIRHQLEALRRMSRRMPLVNRTADIQRIEELLSPLDGSVAPRILCVSGLPGIGRRSLVREVAQRLLNLPRVIDFKIAEGDSISDIAAKIAAKIEPYSTEAGLRDLIDRIMNSSASDQIELIIADLQGFNSRGELPVFVDEGGIIDNFGSLTGDIGEIVNHVIHHETIYLALISRRRPDFANIPGAATIPHRAIQPLAPNDIQRLLQLLCQDESLSLSNSQIAEIAASIKGYPPAVYYALELMRNYGKDALLQDKRRLVEFRETAFMTFLNNRDALSELQRDIITLLANFSPMPLDVIAEITRQSGSTLSQAIVGLIDLSISYVDYLGRYCLSEPLTEVAYKLFRGMDVPYERVARTLAAHIARQNADGLWDIDLDLVRQLYRSEIYAGKGASDAIHLVSDLIGLAKEFYHGQRYEKAFDVGRAALEYRPKSLEARSYVARALVKLESWDMALAEMETMRQQGAVAWAYFLEGFLNRNRHKPREAVSKYVEALQRGYKGVAIHRELAQCYLALDEIDEAERHVKLALTQEEDNPYLVDIDLQIQMRKGNEEAVWQRLSNLEIVGERSRYLHRRSTIAYRFGHFEEAYEAAQEAVRGAARVRFEWWTQLTKCQIKTKRLSDARKELAALDDQFGRVRTDIRLGLHARLEIECGNYSDALGYWERLSEKNQPVHKALRRDALEGLLKYAALRDADRTKYRKQVADLTAQLGAVAVDWSEFDELLAEA